MWRITALRFQKEPEAYSNGLINHGQEYFNATIMPIWDAIIHLNFHHGLCWLTIRLIKHLQLPMVLYCSRTFIICNYLSITFDAIRQMCSWVKCHNFVGKEDIFTLVRICLYRCTFGNIHCSCGIAGFFHCQNGYCSWGAGALLVPPEFILLFSLSFEYSFNFLGLSIVFHSISPHTQA